MQTPNVKWFLKVKFRQHIKYTRTVDITQSTESPVFSVYGIVIIFGALLFVCEAHWITFKYLNVNVWSSWLCICWVALHRIENKNGRALEWCRSFYFLSVFSAPSSAHSEYAIHLESIRVMLGHLIYILMLHCTFHGPHTRHAMAMPSNG